MLAFMAIIGEGGIGIPGGKGYGTRNGGYGTLPEPDGAAGR